MKTTERELVTWMTEWVRRRSLEPIEHLDETTNLLTTGMLDSLSFIQLLADLESRLGQQVDLTDADPEEFTTIRGLVGLAVRQFA